MTRIDEWADRLRRVPLSELALCDDNQFQRLLQSLPRRYACEPIALTAGRGSYRLIAINVAGFLRLVTNENPHHTVVLNLALAAIEELVHAARPELSETQVNGMVNDMAERYLGITIPTEVKERLARIVTGNEAISNGREKPLG